MTDRQERPASLKRPPRPAPDENVDPVDAPAPAPASPPAAPAEVPAAAPAPRRKREITVPFSTRLSPETLDLIDQATAQTGQTIRGVVEEAIRARWGTPTS